MWVECCVSIDHTELDELSFIQVSFSFLLLFFSSALRRILSAVVFALYKYLFIIIFTVQQKHITFTLGIQARIFYIVKKLQMQENNERKNTLVAKIWVLSDA